jgi:hypothetical protein
MKKAIQGLVSVVILTLILGTPTRTFGRGHHGRHHGGATLHVGFGHGIHRHPFLTPPFVPFHHTLIPPFVVFPPPVHGGLFLGFRRGWVPGHWVILDGVWVWEHGHWAVINP